MESDGMNRGSATNHLKRSDTVNVMMMVLPSSAVRLNHFGNQLDFSFCSVSSTAVVVSTEFSGTSILETLLTDAFSGSCTWLLRAAEVPLLQGYWKKEEHGKCFMPSTKEHFEKVLMRALRDPSAPIEFENAAEEKRDLVEEVGGEGAKN